jgi:vacuolar-type H+-ATPase subunit I/STV1
MEALSPAYLTSLAAQLGSLSAFLGGFAATFLGTLLASRIEGRIASLSIGFAVGSSVSFIVCVVASTALVTLLHPDAPIAAGEVAAGQARVLLALSFFLGLYALLVSLALSGWTRSRGTGLATSVIASIGIVLVTMMVAGGG